MPAPVGAPEVDASPGKTHSLAGDAWSYDAARSAAAMPCYPESVASILHADLDSFFASVEQRDRPWLLGKPVIVGEGVVLAASYEAKAFGVRTAMGSRRALRLCPHAVVVSPRMSAYSEASKDV